MKRAPSFAMLCALAAAPLVLSAAEIKKANNTEPLNTGASWALGSPPGAGDVALWDSTVAGANASALEAAATWDGLKVTDGAGALTIAGPALLTLDGGAATDINLTAATRDLTVACPVSMSGTMTTDVTAGRTLVFEGPLALATGGTWSRTGWGSVVFENAITSGVAVALELQRGTNVFTGKSGGLRLTAASTSRMYVGRITGDATLIISNGVHETRGNDQESANFVGLTYRGRLLMEGGSLRVTYLRQAINGGNGEIIVNGGTLEATGSGASGTAQYALMIGNNHTDAATATTGSGTLTVNGGQALFTNGIVKIASESGSSTGAQVVNLNGGVLGARRFYVGASVNVPKTVNLNGGTLRAAASGDLFLGPGATNGTLKVYVGNGGAVIDTGANSVTSAPALLAGGTGGLTKLGAGALTLAGTNTYTGQTRVLSGLLRFSGAAAALHPSLLVDSGGGVSLSDEQLATFAPAAFTNLAAGAATVELELSAAGSACDVLALPAACFVGRLNIAPVVQGTAQRAGRAGDYVILSYAGSAPDLSRFTVSDPVPARTYTFLLNEPEKTVTLRIGFGGGVSEWIAPGSGAWETAANWTAAPANAAGAQVLLGDYALVSPATVTASAPVTLGGVTFSSLWGYTLAGGGFTFDNGASDAHATAERGAHVIGAPLTLAGALSASPAAGASLTLAGAVGGSGSLVKEGAGEVVLSQPNAYSGGTLVKEGSIVLAGEATLGSGAITVNGGSGFRFARTSPLTLSAGLTAATTAHFNAASNDVSLTGPIDWQGWSRALVKSGPYELSLSGTGAETDLCKFQIENGVLRFQAGAAFTLLSTSERDVINMKANNSAGREVLVEPGAQLTAAGIDMEFGASNTVRVTGGRLRLLGGGASGDAVAMRGQGAGVDRFIVDAGEVSVDEGKWFGVGFRTGDAYLVVNGGTTALSRVSLGARDMDMDLSARGFVKVNGGLLTVSGSFGWMGSSTSGRTNMFTLGNGAPGSGVWRTCATANPLLARNNTPIMRFNGGTLEAGGLAAYGASSLSDYLYGAKVVYVDAGGARIDTRGLSIGLSQPLQKGALTDGGLTKLGAGTLTLAGACDFTGATVVEAGALTLPASYASPSLSLAGGAALSLANGSIQTLSLSAAALAAGAAVTFEALADGSCDRIELPAGATVGDLSVAVLQAGTSLTVSKPGDYTLFACAGTPPDTGGWTLLSPPLNRTCSFETVGNAVVLRVAYAAAASVWTASGSGDWDTAGNWSAPPADAAGTAVRFDYAISSPATVARATASTAGSVYFNNASAYTLSGASLTLANVGDAEALLEAEYGVHTLTAPLLLTSNAVVRAAAGAGVALNGGVSGSAALTVEGPGALGLPDTSGLAVGGLTLAQGGTLVVSNTAALSTPVALGGGGGVFAPAAGTTLDVAAAVTGGGALTKGGSSFLVLTNGAAAYTGATRVSAGTLRLDALPAGGLIFGQGTLHVVGAGATTAGGYTLDTGDNTRAGVLRADADVTFQGAVSALSGALVKTGAGTVTFTAPGLNVFNSGNGAGTSHGVLDIGAFGDSPTTGFSGFNVVDGKVVIGAAGQTNVFNGLLVVGLNSTTNADAETAGRLDVVGGRTTVTDTLIVGRSNGTTNTAPVARASKLLVTGGELDVQTLVLGRTLVAAGHSSAPEAELSGGAVTAANAVIVGEQAGVSATLRLSGGTLAAPNIVRVNGAGHLIFDGGSFRPTAESQTLQGLTTAKVGAGGATFDLAAASAFTLSQALTTDGSDGGLTKTGAGTLVVSGKQSYDGPTWVAQGTLRIPASGSLSNATSLAVSPGAALELDTSTTQTVSVAGLALGAASSAPAALTLAIAVDGSGNSRLAVSGPVTLGDVDVTLERVAIGDAFGLSGTYTLITYTEGADPSVAGLRVANPHYGKRYTFAAASGAVTVTVASDYTGAAGGHLWQAPGGGAWSDAGNWVSAPGAGGAGESVLFDDAIAAPSTVTLGSAATVGALYFNSANAYTLAGSATLALDNGASTQAVISVGRGAHVLSAPVSVPDAGVLVQAPSGTSLTLAGATSGGGPLVKASGGNLVAAGPSTRTGLTEIQSGELYVKDGGGVGAGELSLNGAYGVRALGAAASTLSNPVTLKSAPSGAPIFRMEEQPLTLSGPLDWQTGVGVLYKWGTNDLVLAGAGGGSAGTPKLYVRQGGLVFAPGADYTLPGSTRESIKMGLEASIKTTLTIESGARLSLGGLLVSATANNTAGNDALIVQNGGALTLNNVSGDGGDALFLRDWGTAPATYVMNGGTFFMPASAWANVGNFGPGRITVNGGSMTLGRFAAGYQTATNANGGSSEVTVNGGRLQAAGSWSWASDRGARPTYTRVNGGALALPATRAYATNANGWAELTLAGGTLETTGAALDTSATDNYLAGVRRVSLDRAGGAVDTRGLSVTVQQSVLGLSATGGLTKVGAGVLTLAGKNAVWGLVDVQEGTLRAQLAESFLPSEPLFRLGMDTVENPDLSGNGFAPAVANPATFALTSRTATAAALGFSGAGYYTLPHNPHFTSVTDFTVAVWVLITNSTVGSTTSLLSARPGGDRAFELKLNDGNNVVRILQHSTGDWWQEFRTVNAVPLGQWTHVAVSLTPQGVAMYLNGVRQAPIKQVYTSGGAMQDYSGAGYYFPGDFRLVPAGRTGGLIVGRPTSGAGPGFKGALDDLMVFERALSDAEVAALAADAPARPPCVRVSWKGALDLLASTARVAEASGSGQVLGGTLAVTERLAVGDSDEESPGALLSVSDLTLGTNMVYACSADGFDSDLTAVSGHLAVEGAGVIDFGRTEANPIPSGFTATVMTYGTISGAENFASWTVTGLGRRGFEAAVAAADGRVTVTLKATWGTLIRLR